jgi:hypothetical protein
MDKAVRGRKTKKPSAARGQNRKGFMLLRVIKMV